MSLSLIASLFTAGVDCIPFMQRSTECTPSLQSATCNCSFLRSLPILITGTSLAKPDSKGKYLQAYEQIFKEQRICKRGARLLDVGAGDGYQTRWLSSHCGMCQKAYDIAAIDQNNYSFVSRTLAHGNQSFNLSALAKVGNSWSARSARAELVLNKAIHEHMQDFRVYLFDGMHLPEATRSFDLIIFNSVLHHAAGKAFYLLQEAARVTTRHAIVFEDCAVPLNQAVSARNFKHDMYGIFRTENEWRALFNAAGFEMRASGVVGDAKHAKLRLSRAFQRYFVLELSSWTARPTTPR